MIAVVTGAGGFIGSHLCEELIAQGHEVIGIDDLSTGRIENLAKITKHPKFHFRIADITTDPGLYHAMAGADWVFHLAALADIVPSVQYPERYHHVNVTGTLKILEAARAVKAKKVLYSASSSCYGFQGSYPIPEDYTCCPQYPYALTKYVGEQYVRHWSKVYKIPSISLRLFNVYGPRHRTTGNYGAMFGTWLGQMANGHPITIVGDGTQTRDFVFVTDVAKAFVQAAESPADGIYNIGSGETFTVRMIADMLGAKDRIHIPRRPSEPNCTWAKIGMARRMLHWKPNIGIEEGVNFIKSHLDEYKSAPVWTPEKIEVATKSWFEHLGDHR